MRRLFLVVVPLALMVLAVLAVTCEDGQRPDRTRDAKTGSPDSVPPRRAEATDAPRRRRTPRAEPSTLPDETGEPSAPTRTLLIVDPIDRPIPGLAVEFLRSEVKPLGTTLREVHATDVRTDAEGVARPPTGATHVLIPGLRLDGPHPLRAEGETRHVVRDTKPVDVRVVGSPGGEPVDATVVLVAGGALIEIPLVDGVGTLDPSPVRADWLTELEFVVGKSEGRQSRIVAGTVAPRAERVRATIVLRREVTIPVRVLDASGTPVPDARCLTVYEDDGYASARAPRTDAEGRTQVGPFAFFRGTRYVVRMAGETSWGDSPMHVLRDPGQQPELVVRLPEQPRPMKSEDASDSTPQRTARAPSRGMIGQSDGGSVRVRVLDRAGDAAVSVRVEVVDQSGAVRGVEPTDTSGVATISRLPAGTFTTRSVEPGFPSDTVTFSLDDGATGDATLRRIPGDRVRVRLLDEDGNPVPFAEIGLWVGPADVPHPHIVDGAQELQPYTDRLGEIVFEDVGALPWAFFATYGYESRKAEALVTEKTGEVVLRLGE